jgi:hypothetical protein
MVVHCVFSYFGSVPLLLYTLNTSISSVCSYINLLLPCCCAIFGETLNAAIAIGGSVTLFGLYLVDRAKARKRIKPPIITTLILDFRSRHASYQSFFLLYATISPSRWFRTSAEEFPLSMFYKILSFSLPDFVSTYKCDIKLSRPSLNAKELTLWFQNLFRCLQIKMLCSTFEDDKTPLII